MNHLDHTNIVEIPSIPLQNSIVVNHIPSPHSSVLQNIGGVISPNTSSYITEKPIYKKSPPNTQNTYQIDIEHSYTPEPTKRSCYTRYDPNQKTLAYECTTIGTKDKEYSRRESESVQRLGTDQSGVNGNADWVRGNQFGVYYDDAKINNRTNYTTILPKVIPNKITYLSTDSSYPLPKERMWNSTSIWNKEYPQRKTEINNIPFWNSIM